MTKYLFLLVTLTFCLTSFASDGGDGESKKLKRQGRRLKKMQEWSSLSEDERKAKKVEMQKKWQERYDKAPAEQKAKMMARKKKRDESKSFN